MRPVVIAGVTALAGATWACRSKPPELDLLAGLRPEQVMAETRRLDLGEPGQRAGLGDGWSADERDAQGASYVWAVGRRALVYLDLLDPGERILRLRARSLGPQSMVVRLNGQLAATIELAARNQESALPIAARLLRAGRNRLAFEFAHTYGPTANDARALAAAFDWIALEPLETVATPAATPAEPGLDLIAPVRIETVVPAAPRRLLQLEFGALAGQGRLRVTFDGRARSFRPRPNAALSWLLPPGSNPPAGSRLGIELLGAARLRLRAARVVGARATTPPLGPVVVVGIDGLGWPLAERAIARGRMPRLAALRSRGTWATLATVQPTMSIVIWTTIATGRPPDEHGIGGWMAGGQRLASGGARRVRALWELSSNAGQRVDVINYWATWPAAPLRGRMVSDRFRKLLFVPELPQSVYPAGLLPRFEPLLRVDPERERERWEGRGLLRPRADRGRAFSPSATLLELFDNAPGYQAAEELTAAIARELLAERGADLTLVLLRAVDVGIHLRWHFLPPELLAAGLARVDSKDRLPAGLEARLDDALERELAPILVETDRQLGRLLDAAGPAANVVVVSDHGFAFTRHGYTHHRNLEPPPGILVLAGPAIRPAGRLNRASVYDLLPTLLRLLGLPRSRELPGRVLETALRLDRLDPARLVETFETSPIIAPGGPADLRGEKATLDELRSLGYL